MKNTERQASLDKQKWLESEEIGVDMSGCMLYCYHCEHQTEDGFVNWCMIPHEERVEKCLCAKAYNRMVRRIKMRTETSGKNTIEVRNTKPKQDCFTANCEICPKNSTIGFHNIHPPDWGQIYGIKPCKTLTLFDDEEENKWQALNDKRAWRNKNEQSGND